MHWISEGLFHTGIWLGSTTYRSTDYVQPSGKYGLPLHHPRFLEWISAPESARLLDQGPSVWLQSLSREQAIDAARQLHQDVCLMTTNLNILDQYVLCLQGMASKILELSQVPGTFHRRQWLRVPWAPGILVNIRLRSIVYEVFKSIQGINPSYLNVLFSMKEHKYNT